MPPPKDESGKETTFGAEKEAYQGPKPSIIYSYPTLIGFNQLQPLSRKNLAAG